MKVPLAVFEIGDPDRVVVGDILGDTVTDTEPYDGERMGLLDLVIGDCDKVFVILLVTDIVSELVWHRVFKDVCEVDCIGELLNWLVLLILVKDEEVYERAGDKLSMGVCDSVDSKLDVCCEVRELVITLLYEGLLDNVITAELLGDASSVRL